MDKPFGTVEELADYIGRDHRSWDHHQITYNINAFDQSAQPDVIAAFDEWSRVTNLNFVRVYGYSLQDEKGYNPDADIVFATDGPAPDGTPDSFGFTRVNGGQPGGDVIHAAYINFSHDWSSGNFQPGSWGYTSLLHEIGHALGLEHLGPYNRGDGNDPVTQRIWANDTLQYSLMSYNPQHVYIGGSGGYTFEPGASDGNPVTPMIADIVAAQKIYGANSNAASGDTIYGYNATPDGYSLDYPTTIYDTGGVNTIDDSGSPLGSSIYLNPGQFSSLGGYSRNVAIAPGTLIQNALGGGGSNDIWGNSADNYLQGGSSNDYLDGSYGNDTLRGGLGDDYLDGGAGVNTAVFSGTADQYTLTFDPDETGTILDPVYQNQIGWPVDGSDYIISGPDGTDHLANINFLQFGSSPAISINYFLHGRPGWTTTGATITTSNDISTNINSPGKEGWFLAPLVAGVTYWFNAEGSSTGRGSFPDPYLRLLGIDGVTQLASDNGSGIGENSFIKYTPAVTGYYYLLAGSASGGTGSFSLSERVADDYPSNPATTGTLTAGGSVVGTYDFVADKDWFRTALTAGTTYRFVMKSTPTGPETDIQPRLKLYGTGGTIQLAADNNDRGEATASITFTPTTSGTYYVSAESFGSHVGTYQVGEAATPVTPTSPPKPNDVTLSGVHTQYVIAATSDGKAYLQDTTVGRDGTQTVTNPGELRFADGTGIFDATGNVEAVTRLYQAAFNRAPDVAGIDYSTALINAGSISLAKVADGFITSDEFNRAYGNPDTRTFVTSLYQNVLHRGVNPSDPLDVQGVQNFSNLADSQGRGAALLAMSDSQENHRRTLPISGDRIDAETTRLYQAAFNRAPDAAGFDFMQNALRSGVPADTLAEGFVASGEFQRAYGSLSSRDFVG